MCVCVCVCLGGLGGLRVVAGRGLVTPREHDLRGHSGRTGGWDMELQGGKVTSSAPAGCVHSCEDPH